MFETNSDLSSLNHLDLMPSSPHCEEQVPSPILYPELPHVLFIQQIPDQLPQTYSILTLHRL